MAAAAGAVGMLASTQGTPGGGTEAQAVEALPRPSADVRRTA